MKINGIRPGVVGSGPGTGRLTKPGSATGSSKVAVSSSAKQLAGARAPEVADGARVARLSLAVASGEFTVDADAIAERMAREEM